MRFNTKETIGGHYIQYFRMSGILNFPYVGVVHADTQEKTQPKKIAVQWDADGKAHLPLPFYNNTQPLSLKPLNLSLKPLKMYRVVYKNPQHAIFFHIGNTEYFSYDKAFEDGNKFYKEGFVGVFEYGPDNPDTTIRP